jgi:copper(I)-binding protein
MFSSHHPRVRRRIGVAASIAGMALAVTACGSSSTSSHTGQMDMSSTAAEPTYATASASLGALRITGAYIPKPASPAAYFTVYNSGPADRLMSASSTVSKQVGLHQSVVTGSTGEMIDIPSLAIPTGATVAFKPGSYHVMMENPATLTVGEKVPVTLTFQHAGAITLDVPVVPLTAVNDDSGSMSMSGMGS